MLRPPPFDFKMVRIRDFYPIQILGWMFHCKDCIENINRCTEKFPLWLPAQEDQTDGVWHIELSKFLKDGRIDWKGVQNLVNVEQTH